MISISLSNITLVLGARTILQNLTWEIQADQKIGLIGPNGAGKSSLLKLIVAEHSPEPGGTIAKTKGVTIGYLPQHPEFPPCETAFSLVSRGNPRIAEIETELNQVESQMSDPLVYNNTNTLERAIHSQQKLIEEYEAIGAASYSSRVLKLLSRLGLPDSDLKKTD